MRNLKRRKIITALAVSVFLACVISACKRIPTASGEIREAGTTQETPYTEQTQQTESRLQAEGEPQTESKSQAESEPQTESESLETPESEATPKETDALSSEDYIRQKLSSMTLMEKVCQMFFVTPESIAGITPVTSCGEEMKNALERYPVGGVMCTLKHFPGHGDTASDSHYESAYVNKTRQEIEAQEMLPFAAGIENRAEFVMVGHLIVADISTKPATLSYTVIQEILREKMGFDGIVITDAMAMSALSEHYSVEEMTVQAIEAGNDMLLMPPDVPAAVNAVLQAVKDGRISEERIDESVERILEVKLKKEIWKP